MVNGLPADWPATEAFGDKEVTAMQVTMAREDARDLDKIVIGQLVGFTQILDKALSMLARADNGDDYAVLSEQDARNLRALLGAIAAAMTRQKAA